MKSISVKDRFWMFHPAYLLFMLLLALPASRNGLKAAVIGIAALTLGLQILGARYRWSIHPTVMMWFLYYVMTGFAFVFYGYLSGNPGAIFSLLIYVVWPLVYFAFIGCISDMDKVKKVSQLILFGNILAGGLVINQFLYSTGIIPKAFHIQLMKETNTLVSQGTGVSKTNTFVLATLVYSVPYALALLMLEKDMLKKIVVRRWVVWTCLAVGVLGMLFGGRRAGLLTFGMSPIFVLAGIFALPGGVTTKRLRSLVGFAVGMIAIYVIIATWLGGLTGWSLSGQIDMVQSSFDFQNDQGAQLRQQQARALTEGWKENPFFGSGFGAAAPGSIRSDREWEYELQYLLILFHTGTFGFLLYSLGVGWLYWKAFRIIRGGGPLAGYMIPYMVGTSGFLIANATNPYLQAYGQLWTLFLPIALVNLHLLGVDRGRKPFAARSPQLPLLEAAMP